MGVIPLSDVAGGYRGRIGMQDAKGSLSREVALLGRHEATDDPLAGAHTGGGCCPQDCFARFRLVLRKSSISAINSWIVAEPPAIRPAVKAMSVNWNTAR